MIDHRNEKKFPTLMQGHVFVCQDRSQVSDEGTHNINNPGDVGVGVSIVPRRRINYSSRIKACNSGCH